MKTYHEMTESVLEKAGTEIVKKERRRRNGVFIAASGLCFALVLTVLGMGMEQPPAVLPTLSGEQPELSADATDVPQPTQRAEVKITYLTNIEGQTTQKALSPDVSVPLNGMVCIRDVRGLSEEEIDKVKREMSDLFNGFILNKKSSITTWGGSECIVSTAVNGAITLDFTGCPLVKKVDYRTTGVGGIGVWATLSEKRPAGTKGIYWPYVLEADFRWSVNGGFVDKIEEDPTIPLESIRDTVTITVYYDNETTETFIFDITVNEEGYIFVTQRGIPILAA